MGVTRKDKIRNNYIKGAVKVERLGMKMRESRLRWYGHVMTRDKEYIGRRAMEIELTRKRKRGRQKRTFLDVVKKDMGKVGASATDIEKQDALEKHHTLIYFTNYTNVLILKKY